MQVVEGSSNKLLTTSSRSYCTLGGYKRRKKINHIKREKQINRKKEKIYQQLEKEEERWLNMVLLGLL